MKLRKSKSGRSVVNSQRVNSAAQGLRFELLEPKNLLAGIVGSEMTLVDIWQPVSIKAIAVPQDRIHVEATTFRLFDIKEDAVWGALERAPMEFTKDAELNPLVISIAAPNGTFQRFEVVEAPIMEAELAAKFPDIKTYRGVGLDDPGSQIRLDTTMHGFHAQVLSPAGAWYIDPYFHLETDFYAAYYRTDALRQPDSVFEETVVGKEVELFSRDSGDGGGLNGAAPFGNQIRSYRTVVAATGEYTTFHGGTVPAGQAAIVTAMNRVNGLYENDLSVRMVLVANNNLVVYTNGATDPYSNNSGGAMLGQNQSNVDSVIGSANYDLGHVFSTGGGGVAGLGVIAVNGQKARGVTGLPSPVGDPFYVDFVAHEMGHQYGGNHTFNGAAGNCAGGNRSGSHAYEPGSGTTIQAYAGICGVDNLQSNSDAMFHSESIDEIRAKVTSGVADAAATKINTANNIPSVNAGADYVIPANTPFELTAIGSDADGGDVLTYSWEERDLGPQVNVSVGDNGSSPIFRTWLPSIDPTRTFPRLSNLLSNTVPFGETLPATNRTMTYRAVVRDNSALSGGVASDDMTVQSVITGSAFQVTSQNGATNWTGGTSEVVTWNVAGTTAAPINAANVDILLSTDGGQTYPTVLAAGTTNDGTQSITVPNVSTGQARIKVKGTGNVFFDINNTNFTIAPGVVGDVAVVESGGSTDISESGITDTYTLGLTTTPTGTVQITATADAQSEVSLNGSVYASSVVLSFNDTTAQTIHVRAIDDLIHEGVHPSTITHQVTSTGDPSQYPLSLAINSVVATVTDNEACTTTDTAVGPLNSGIAVTDNATGTGYVMYSEESLFTRFGTSSNSSTPGVYPNNATHLVAVRLNGSQWQYNTNFAWKVFEPIANDRLLANVDFSADSVTSLEGTSSTVNGIQAGYSSGDLVFTPNIWNGVPNNGEFGATGTNFTHSVGTVRTVTPLNFGIAVTDNATGTGYVMYSEESLFTRFGTSSNSSTPGVYPNNATHLVAVRLNGSQWQYNTNFAWKVFEPIANDRLLADVNFSADSVTSLEGTSSTVNGIQAGYICGDLVFTPNIWNGVPNSGEFGAAGTFFTYTAIPNQGNVTPLNYGIAVTDDATGTGYIMYSEGSLFTRFGTSSNSSTPGVYLNNATHLVAVRLNGSQWQYNTNFAWKVFEPIANDRLLANVDFSADSVTSLEGTSSTVNGIEAGYSSGDLVFTPNMWNGVFNSGEFGATGTFFDV